MFRSLSNSLRWGGCLFVAALVVWPARVYAMEQPVEEFSSYIRLQESPSAYPSMDRPNISIQATSTDPVNDDRVAALWELAPSGSSISEGTPRRECTANHLEGKFWITAHHCVSQNPSMRGYLEQHDGELAGIENIYTLSGQDDVALIKVGRGISATTFELPARNAQPGDVLTLIGYGATNVFSSTALSQITAYVDELDFGTAIYTDLVEATSVTPSRSCSGDSGGAIFEGNIIYAIHTAGGYNPYCADGQHRKMWHTNLFSRVNWIEETIRFNSGTTLEEHQRAFEGLSGHPSDSGTTEDGVNEDNNALPGNGNPDTDQSEPNDGGWLPVLSSNSSSR